MGIFAGVMSKVIKGPVYVVQDNIDTDQIIPAQYLNLIPTIAEEYEKLGSYALCGLPDSLYNQRYVEEGKLDSHYPIVVAGRNFGCGSSREHAPSRWVLRIVSWFLQRVLPYFFPQPWLATGELCPVIPGTTV